MAPGRILTWRLFYYLCIYENICSFYSIYLFMSTDNRQQTSCTDGHFVHGA